MKLGGITTIGQQDGDMIKTLELVTPQTTVWTWYQPKTGYESQQKKIYKNVFGTVTTKKIETVNLLSFWKDLLFYL